MSVSCAVRSFAVSTERARTVSPVAASSRRVRSAKPSIPGLGEEFERRPQVFARIHPPPVSTQPFAVDQVRARKRDSDARATEAFDGLLIQALCDVVAFSRARHRATTPSDQSVSLARAISASRSSAGAPRSAWSLRTAASISSG